VSFADDLSATATGFLKQSWEDAGNEITTEFDSMMTGIQDTAGATDQKLRQLATNFGTNFTTKAIPALNATAAAIAPPG